VSLIFQGWSNVRSVYIKTDDSLSLPIYVSAKEPDDIDVKDEEELLYIEKKQAQRKRDVCMFLTSSPVPYTAQLSCSNEPLLRRVLQPLTD